MTPLTNGLHEWYHPVAEELSVTCLLVCTSEGIV